MKKTKKNSSKIGATGRKIMAKAKAIRKKNPGMKWQNCVKKAAKSL